MNVVFCFVWFWLLAWDDTSSSPRTYVNQLVPISDPRPILADQPDFVEPVEELARFRSPILIQDPAANLDIPAWRFSYNARGIIEIPNRLDGRKTAVIVVHPWGIDDSQGWRTPEPAGVAFGCTPAKNALMHEHARRVVAPLLKRLRSDVKLVAYSLPGKEDAIRQKLYRSFRQQPSEEQREEGRTELRRKLGSFNYQGQPLPTNIELRSGRPAVDYFEQFPGLEAYQRAHPKGFWDLPIPVMDALLVDPADVVIYDGDGYEALKAFLNEEQIEHVLLCGYHADMCVCSTTAGYENLRNDFNVFLVGDAVQASLPANKTAKFSTNHAVSTASLKVLITQTSWIKRINKDQANDESN